MKLWIHANTNSIDSYIDQAIVHVEESNSCRDKNYDFVLSYMVDSPDKFANAVIGFLEDMGPNGPKFSDSDINYITNEVKKYYNDNYVDGHKE